MDLRDKNMLVTGGAGFIGSHVCEYFAERGCKVIAFDSLERGKLLEEEVNQSYNLRFLKKLNNVKFIRGDVRDFKALKTVCNDVDAIIHTAAQVAVTTSLKNPREDFEINALGTFNVLEAARQSSNDPRIIYCSTNKVYGSNVNNIPVRKRGKRYEFADEKFERGISENFPVDLCEHTPYGSSKLAGDIYVQDYGYIYGLKTGVFRMSCIYGTRQFGVQDQGWVAWFAIATLLGKPITIYGDGSQVRDILYVDDLVRAYELFLKSNLKQEVFNIGGGPENTISLLELLDLLEELTGKRTRIEYSDWRPGDQKVYISDIRKAKEKLHWEAKIGPKKGVSKMIKWMEANPLRDI
ncbi:MAG: SDR family NAD(P)-dependent oxidoreductase [Candidatus Freyarchaeota archaeon]|nr:SDR family NAD(P)-dependent oxidoreductase [Candidatus Jordarchaeia archaeon]MBS7270060.1 SDR family NAD(P)-dependent oxidoreductase [Candidatus Jordarchaeia archaeon]MBS7278340.1 SDR family NAD(P)-dependent oxidoreductase [Candidatus Jordarchaeia archaeon]